MPLRYLNPSDRLRRRYTRNSPCQPKSTRRPPLREGRRLYPRAAGLSEVTERVLLGGVASLIASRLLAEKVDRLPGRGPEIAEFLLAPHLGPAEAREFVSS
ncbi:MAG TPA: hypothetical protein VNY83_00195 [Solirubrobacterales bacterium]|jgi:hypothetical protein|nr:hypothetical protein [Solirubrobacterales bacterium]